MDNQEINRIVSQVVSQMSSGCGKCGTDSCDCVKSITLAQAKRLISRVEAKAEEIGVNAVVAVSNTAARPVAIECMDDSFIASYDVALNKAFTVVALKMSTIKLKSMTNPGDSLYGIQFTNNGQIVIFGGGDPLVYNGKIIGGLGVSGGTEEQDTLLSAYGASVLEEIMKGE
ncbi:MAG: heme-binding protein [Clostridia bacterium]|nr:heme-binding protein [Clostridia bacterium]